jgi:hypothetical protein
MKTRISLLVSLGMIAALCAVACRGRDQPAALTPTTIPGPLIPTSGVPSPPLFGGPPQAGLPVTNLGVSVTPSSFSGGCPKTFYFVGSITASGPTRVNYQWEWMDHAIGPSGTATFTAAGTLQVTTERSQGSSGTGWARLRLTSHGNISSNQVAYTLTCTTGAPPPVPAAQADLIVADAIVTSAANPGEARIHILARNQGGPISAAFTIRWHPHEKDKAQVGCSQDFYNLNQNEWSVDCSYTYPANLCGEMHWVAIVDAENDVKNEANENNNEKAGTITIGCRGAPQPSAQPSIQPQPTVQPTIRRTGG